MRRILNIIILILLIAPVIKGQKMINSPYSRFGPGSVELQGILKSRSMGGAGIALRDPVSINYLNPASYSSVDTNSFVFDFGLEYQGNMLQNADEKYYSDDINFHHLAMAFPVTKWLGLATGIIPYSNGYYNLEKSVAEGDPEYNPVIGEIQNNHKGSGSYNRFFFGLGISPVKNLSVGANFTFLFGEIKRDNLYLFLDDNNQFNNVSTEKIRLNGFNFEYGVQYTAEFGTDLFVTGGLVYSMKKTYSAEYESLFYRYAPFQGALALDTLTYISDDNADAQLPGTFGVGLSFGKKDKYLLSADYSMSNWSECDFLGYERYFTNSSSVRLGAELIPDRFANYNYLNRVEYRVGGHFSESHLVVNGEQLNEFGITFGAGLPLNRTNSRINLHLEYLNRKGSYENGLHSEKFMMLGISLNLYDYWFIKKKYN